MKIKILKKNNKLSNRTKKNDSIHFFLFSLLIFIIFLDYFRKYFLDPLSCFRAAFVKN
jgi:hypothetical protein